MLLKLMSCFFESLYLYMILLLPLPGDFIWVGVPKMFCFFPLLRSSSGRRVLMMLCSFLKGLDGCCGCD